MSLHFKKSIVGLAGMFFVSSELSAGTITWSLAQAQAVPMSTTALIAMAAMFLFAGTWMLVKTNNKQAAKLFAIGLVVAGLGMVNQDADANALPVITITTPSGTQSFQNAVEIKNESGSPVSITITPIDVDACRVNNECPSILADGDTCSVEEVCEVP